MSGIVSPSLNPSAEIDTFSMLTSCFAIQPEASKIMIQNNASSLFMILTITPIDNINIVFQPLKKSPGFLCSFFQFIQDQSYIAFVPDKDHDQCIGTCFINYKLLIICFNNN